MSNSSFMFIHCSRLCHCMSKYIHVYLRFQVSGMWHCVLGLIIPDVSKEHRTFISRVKLTFFNYLIQKFKALRSFERSRRVAQETASVVSHDVNNSRNIAVRISDLAYFSWALSKISHHFLAIYSGTCQVIVH